MVQVAKGLKEVSVQEGMLSVLGTSQCPHREPSKGLWGQAEAPMMAAVSEGGSGGVMGRGGRQGGHNYVAEPGESSGCPRGQWVLKARVPTRG